MDKLPDFDPTKLVYSFDELKYIVDRLREDCPWDREQTAKTLKRFLIEEVFEVAEAIDDCDDVAYSQELGDVLLHILMHSKIASERDAFNFDDVVSAISHKLIRRHPHVFGDLTIEEADAVIANWELLKSGESEGRMLLDGIPRNLPAMLRAHRIQDRARTVGFEWEDAGGVLDKLEEEIGELRAAIGKDNQRGMQEELGDLFFSLINLCRYMDIDPQDALNGTNDKFTRRFSFVEKSLKTAGRPINSATLDELEELWQQAKNADDK